MLLIQLVMDCLLNKIHTLLSQKWWNEPAIFPHPALSFSWMGRNMLLEEIEILLGWANQNWRFAPRFHLQGLPSRPANHIYTSIYSSTQLEGDIGTRSYQTVRQSLSSLSRQSSIPISFGSQGLKMLRYCRRILSFLQKLEFISHTIIHVSEPFRQATRAKTTWHREAWNFEFVVAISSGIEPLRSEVKMLFSNSPEIWCVAKMREILVRSPWDTTISSDALAFGLGWIK